MSQNKVMFRFSKKVDYTILLVTDLFERKEIISAADLAKKYDLSQDLVSNLLKNLARNGFVSSVRGKHGGYRISVEPSELSLMDLVKSVDGPVSLTDCGHDEDGGGCRIAPICGSKFKMLEITHRVNRILSEVNLSEILVANEKGAGIQVQD
jgi:Rrf2 family protein